MLFPKLADGISVAVFVFPMVLKQMLCNVMPLSFFVLGLYTLKIY